MKRKSGRGRVYGRPVGPDNSGLRPRNKYPQGKPVQPPARIWCNATNGYNEHCTLAANHPGIHDFKKGPRT